jgi:hypothetical protein
MHVSASGQATCLFTLTGPLLLVRRGLQLCAAQCSDMLALHVHCSQHLSTSPIPLLMLLLPVLPRPHLHPPRPPGGPGAHQQGQSAGPGWPRQGAAAVPGGKRTATAGMAFTACIAALAFVNPAARLHAFLLAWTGNATHRQRSCVPKSTLKQGLLLSGRVFPRRRWSRPGSRCRRQ